MASGNMVPSSMTSFRTLAIENPTQLLFGVSPRPVTTRSGMRIGGGLVYPELNFTLPTMLVTEQTMPEVLRHYTEIVTEATRRAAELEAPGLLLEFEALPPMTENPDWGMDVVHVLLDGIEKGESKYGLKAALRVTPNDTREMIRPPRMRSGALYENMLALFERSAAAGADLLSIESVGGKEVHDEALVSGDLELAIFGLCVMGVRDMRFLWTEITGIARRHGVHPAGDTACGFANTAMVMAEQRLIPRVFAAVIRAVSAVRSLVAYECGAVGPGKDCGYENVFLKAITGCPMAMEGKTASCAHLSPVGNVSAAMADTWSNESVQNVKLLGGMAPICSLETLIYDCRLMNEAIADGPEAARTLRDWMVRSDARFDPQALILTPASAVRVARAIVVAPNPYRAGIAAAREAIAILSDAAAQGACKISDREAVWFDRMTDTLDDLPSDEDAFIERTMAQVDRSTFVAEDYLLAERANA
ncbi:MAG: hypothetical protein KIS66_08360 [Fimbriimonadaceae bacterium]|nr:hypothetical protein [Fimbriimonadaceae bacterium]